MSHAKNWPPELIAAIRAQLAGNTRLDLLSWANRVKRNPPNKIELARARLVLAIDEAATAQGAQA